MTTTVTKLIDVDAGGLGHDYTSLDNWEDNLGGTTSGDLVNDDEIAVAQCANSAGSADTTDVDIDGWTTGAANYILIEPYTGYRHAGSWSASKYHLTLTNGNGILMRENYVRMDGLQIEVVETGTNTAYGIRTIAVAAGGSDFRISNCIFKGTCSGTGAAIGVNNTDSDCTITFWNVLIYDFVSGNDIHFKGVSAQLNDNLHNCTINNCYVGIYSSGAAGLHNTVIFECTNDVDGASITLEYCATDDGDDSGNNGNITITQSADDYAAMVIDADGGDYNVTDTDSELYNACSGDQSGGLYSDDIAGNSRDGNWDIGCFEYVAAGGVSIPVIMYHYLHH